MTTAATNLRDICESLYSRHGNSIPLNLLPVVPDDAGIRFGPRGMAAFGQLFDPAHSIVRARVIGLDDALNRLHMIGHMLIRAVQHEPITHPHRHRASILDLPLLPPLSLARYGDKGSISRDGYKREHGSPPGTSIG